jgi:chromosome partitioning protein
MTTFSTNKATARSRITSAPKRIVFANSKGGCGKSTLATNLASFYAKQGTATALLDYDPQGSATHWLKRRNENAPLITGIEAFKTKQMPTTRNWFMRLPRGTERVIVDTPAGLQGSDLVETIADADLIIVPVLPSPIDIHSATRFISSILLSGVFRREDKRLLVLANRVRKNTRSLDKLDLFLNSLKLPRTGNIRDTQNYVHCSELGGGIVDFPSARTKNDQLQWNELVNWIDQQLTNSQLGKTNPPTNAVDGEKGKQQVVTKVAEKQSPSSKSTEEVYTVV